MSVVAERGTDTRPRCGPEHTARRSRPEGGQFDDLRPSPRQARPVGRRPDHEPARPGGRARVVAVAERTRVSGCSARAGVRRWPGLAVLAIVVFAIVLGFGLLADGMSAPVPESTAVVVVEPGQTLWELAERFAPSSDPDAVLERILRLNGLTSPAIEAGTPLVVPSGQPDTVADRQ